MCHPMHMPAEGGISIHPMPIMLASLKAQEGVCASGELGWKSPRRGASWSHRCGIGSVWSRIASFLVHRSGHSFVVISWQFPTFVGLDSTLAAELRAPQALSLSETFHNPVVGCFWKVSSLKGELVRTLGFLLLWTVNVLILQLVNSPGKELFQQKALSVQHVWTRWFQSDVTVSTWIGTSFPLAVASNSSLRTWRDRLDWIHQETWSPCGDMALGTLESVGPSCSTPVQGVRIPESCPHLAGEAQGP